MKVRKRILEVATTITLIAIVLQGIFITNVSAVDDGIRYTVLVLDTAGSVSFTSDGVKIYTADSAIEYVRTAACTFTKNVLTQPDENRIAVVRFNEDATVVSDFSNNITELTEKINQPCDLLAGRDISSGLKAAENLLDNVSADSSLKNIVLFTTGMTSYGNYSDTGHYSNSTVGSNWIDSSSNVEIYKYSNYACFIADSLKDKAKIYSLGLFQNIDNMPSAGREIVSLFKSTAEDIATSPEYFYDVDDPNELEITFGNVANTIIENPIIPVSSNNTVKTSFGATVSDWAAPEIETAFENNLIPELMLDFDLTKKVNRGEFAAIALQLYDVLMQGETALPSNCPFIDINGDVNEQAIKKAYGIQITTGTSNNTFEPVAFINREQLATMLCRVIKKYSDPNWNMDNDANYYLDTNGVQMFADDSYISDWAKPSVYFMSKFGIVKGVDETHFAPKNTTNQQEASGYASATREQAIILAQRIFKISDIWN
jgi:hypothetical protein